MPRKPKPLSTAERPKSTSATRMKRQATKMRELGYVPRQVWSKPQHWEAIVAFALRLNRD